MKFGLKLRGKHLVADFGGIGEYIADSLSNDPFVLKDLVNNIKFLQKNGKGEIRIQRHNYKYLIVKPTVVTAFFYDEFEDESQAEIEMGYFSTSDLIEIVDIYMNFLKKINFDLIEKLEPIYAKLEKFLKNKSHQIHAFRKNLKRAEILLKSGNEKVDLYYIMKTYHLSFDNDKLSLKKNRQYANSIPVTFEVNEKGCNSLLSFLEEDINKWYSEKMKMYYEGNKLIITSDGSV